MAFTCFLVDKEAVLTQFPAIHDNVFAQHITFEFGVPNDSPLPAMPERVFVVGEVSNCECQALIVEVDGAIYRPDGGVFHITISTSDDVKPVTSNDVIKQGWSESAPLAIWAKPHIVNW